MATGSRRSLSCGHQHSMLDLGASAFLTVIDVDTSRAASVSMRSLEQRKCFLYFRIIALVAMPVGFRFSSPSQ